MRRRFYIDIAQANANPRHLDDAVRSLPGDGIVRENFDRDIVLDVSTREKELEMGFFPLSLTYEDAGTEWIMDYADRDAAKQFLNGVLGPMKAYTIPSIELDRQTSKEAVATVFEKVNTGGLPLTVFELLTAKFASDADYYRTNQTDFRLKDDWEATRKVITTHSVLCGIEETEFLQAVMLLTSRASTSATTARKEDNPEPGAQRLPCLGTAGPRCHGVACGVP